LINSPNFSLYIVKPTQEFEWPKQKIGKQNVNKKLSSIIESYNGISKGEEDDEEEGSRRKEELFNFPFVRSESTARSPDRSI